jgi:hypothetical protein
MVMGVDERFHRLVGNFPELFQDFPGFLQTLHGVHNNQAVVSFDHDGVRQAEPHRRINVIAHLIDLPFKVFGELLQASRRLYIGDVLFLYGRRGGKLDEQLYCHDAHNQQTNEQ